MSLREKKLGLLLSTRPDTANFRHGVNLARAALAADVKVYLYASMTPFTASATPSCNP
jgi:hypothetical protein